jgi:hypothetical protein
LPMEGSAAQCGINPQCMSLDSLPALWWTMTGMVGEVCSGAMLKRGVYFGRSRSRFQRTLMSLNSNVAVMRPHMSGKSSVVFVERQDCFNARLDQSEWAQALAEHHERRAFRHHGITFQPLLPRSKRLNLLVAWLLLHSSPTRYSQQVNT